MFLGQVLTIFQTRPYIQSFYSKEVIAFTILNFYGHVPNVLSNASQFFKNRNLNHGNNWW